MLQPRIEYFGCIMSVAKDFNYSGISVTSMRGLCFLEGL